MTKGCCGKDNDSLDEQDIKNIVKKNYGRIAKNTDCGCCCDSFKTMSNEDIAHSIGYSDEELDLVPDANLGLGCGNPTALGLIESGETVLDLGSGAGLDCFLAAKKVGDNGKVFGVDMTSEMISTASDNAERFGFSNVEFRLGDIENLPVEDNSVDVIISNCVINLAPNKDRVFNESYRVLKKGGRMYISDIVLLRELSAALRKNEELIYGCVAGAILRDRYLQKIENAGFRVRILDEDKDISKRQYQGIALESLKLEAIKE